MMPRLISYYVKKLSLQGSVYNYFVIWLLFNTNILKVRAVHRQCTDLRGNQSILGGKEVSGVAGLLKDAKQ